MKNQNHLRRALRFVRTELEVTLAVLVLLAFIVGFSFAQTPTSKIAAQQLAPETSASPQLVIGTRNYDGIIFGANQVDGYKIITKLTGGAQYYDTDGISLVDTSATYTYSVILNSPLDATPWYLDFEGTPTNLSLNDQQVTSPTQAINLNDASQLKLSATGNLTLKGISHIPGTATSPADKAETIASLFIAPATTQISVGASRKFIVVALTKDSQSVSADNIINWTSSDPKIASISRTTGLLSAIRPGQVQITARANSTTVSTATVTVIAPEDQEPILSPITSNTTPSKETAKPSNTDTEQGASSESTDQVEPPVPFSAHPSQNDINTATANLSTPQRFAYVLKNSWNEVWSSLSEIAVGSNTVNPDGTTTHTPSAFERIATFFENLF